jgi:hypothetical protein
MEEADFIDFKLKRVQALGPLSATHWHWHIMIERLRPLATDFGYTLPGWCPGPPKVVTRWWMTRRRGSS